jgi:hypothetical protein
MQLSRHRLAFVRDNKLNLVYYGLLEQYSDPGETRELLLSNVSVYTNDTANIFMMFQSFTSVEITTIFR